jgi:hypothetical protein
VVEELDGDGGVGEYDRGEAGDEGKDEEEEFPVALGAAGVETRGVVATGAGMVAAGCAAGAGSGAGSGVGFEPAKLPDVTISAAIAAAIGRTQRRKASAITPNHPVSFTSPYSLLILQDRAPNPTIGDERRPG